MRTETLWTALSRLDRRLAAAVEAADIAYGREAAGDRFRGLHIGSADVDRLLAREAGTPLFGVAEVDADVDGRDEGGSRLHWLSDAFELSDFDRDVVLVALAPEVDLRYERLYAYLQDDVTRRRPSVDLVLNLLCASREEKLERRRRFAADAPLLRHGIVRLVPDQTQSEAPLLAHAIKLDDQIVRRMVDDEGLDGRLAGVAWTEDPARLTADVPLDSGLARALRALGTRAREDGDRAARLRVHLHGPDAGRRRRAAAEVAAAAGLRMLAVDLSVPSRAEDAAALVPIALREAWLHGALALLEGCDRLWDREAAPPSWVRALTSHPGTVVVSSALPMNARVSTGTGEPIGLLSLAVGGPAEAERRSTWEARAHATGFALGAAEAEALADRFRLTSGQIAEAAAVAEFSAFQRGAAEAATAADFFAAARERGAWDVQGFARRITPRRQWDALVVPEDTLAQLHELCQRALHARLVLSEWGFDTRLTLGSGTTALFTGPSGTGKTMAAEVIAGALGLDLYKVDLSGVVSKWIGETEKNLDRVFRAAEGGGGVLFFDEADALFGKRSEVRDSHDRYANVEISYLLQRMEEYDGVAILATNLRANLDDAFVRRLSFVVHFPFPDERGRLRIWERIWPDDLPLEALDLGTLAREVPLTGGHIRNVALAAAYLAAADGGRVRMEHVRQAVRREFQKRGKHTDHVAAAAVATAARQ